MEKFVFNREYNEDVDEMRKNRVRVSFYKYGSASKNFGRGYVNALGSHDKCIEMYKQTKNKEYLLDAMNYLMFEFMYPQQEGVFFQATDSSGSAGIEGISVKEMEQLKEQDY